MRKTGTRFSHALSPPEKSGGTMMSETRRAVAGAGRVKKPRGYPLSLVPVVIVFRILFIFIVRYRRCCFSRSLLPRARV